MSKELEEKSLFSIEHCIGGGKLSKDDISCLDMRTKEAQKALDEVCRQANIYGISYIQHLIDKEGNLINKTIKNKNVYKKPRRTKQQIKQLILEAMTSTPKVIKTSEVMKATGLSHATVVRYKEEIYKQIMEKK